MASAKYVLIIASIITLTALPVSAEIRLPALVGDNMVLQQNSICTIWGWDKPGQKITVKPGFATDVAETVTGTDGKWQVRLKTNGAGGPYDITITGSSEITIQNVLLGEVWVCSGQSNMEWMLDRTDTATEEIARANQPEIRIFTVLKSLAAEPREDVKGLWLEVNPNTIAKFAAVAYHFALNLRKEINVPIGLIHSSWGGASAQTWMSIGAINSYASFSDMENNRKKAIAGKAFSAYINKLKKWRDDKHGQIKKGLNYDYLPPMELYADNLRNTPTLMYNAMIAPLTDFRIRGVLWYQGESNAGNPEQYGQLFPALIKDWRDKWGQGDFPFYYVQLAPFAYNKPIESQYMRQVQTQTLDFVTNTGMAVILDIGEADKIHPKNKRDVGKRLALWALAKTYDRPNIVYSGPIVKDHIVKNEQVYLTFDHIGSGLELRGENPPGFEIADSMDKYVPARAKIDAGMVVVWADEIKKPELIRYAWANCPEISLFNKEGLPASSFKIELHKD